ncbi:MAG TPA: TlpA disulfide reductase family protein [Pirellulaceae bacterium]
MHWSTRFLGSVCLLGAVTGCQPNGFSLFRDEPKLDDSSALSGPLVEVNGTSLGQRIANHQGQVVLVDYWATWCPPCRAAFPHSVELGTRYASQGLKFIAVSLDARGQHHEAASFVATHGANVESYVSEYGSGSRSFEEFRIDSGAIPYYQLYDRRGELRYTFTGSSPEIETRLQELLQEPAA